MGPYYNTPLDHISTILCLKLFFSEYTVRSKEVNNKYVIIMNSGLFLYLIESKSLKKAYT